MRLAHQRMALWLILNQIWKSKMEIPVELGLYSTKEFKRWII